MTRHNAEAPFTEDDERQMLDAIGKWLEREVRPQVLALEHADAYPRAMVERCRHSACSARRSGQNMAASACRR
jgi:hypothetical protein